MSREGLGEGYDGDIAFASSLEMFGGGHNDPISVAFGGWSFIWRHNLLLLCAVLISDRVLKDVVP